MIVYDEYYDVIVDFVYFSSTAVRYCPFIYWFVSVRAV